MIKLTPRIEAIAQLVPQAYCVGDIGADHGYLCISLVQRGITHTAIAADINLGPLNNAKKNIKKYGLTDKIKTVISNGLANIPIASCDCIVIAGMGGGLICDILSDCSFNGILILQPMTDVYRLRKFLNANNFYIIEEQLAIEGSKIYNIIKTIQNCADVQYSEQELYIGKYIMHNNVPHKSEYYAKILQRCKKITNGLKGSNNIDYELLNFYERLVEIVEKDHVHKR